MGEIVKSSPELSDDEKYALFLFIWDKRADIYTISRDRGMCMSCMRKLRDSLVKRGWVVRMPRQVGPDGHQVRIPDVKTDGKCGE